MNESAENAFHGLNIGVYQGVIESVDLSDENGTVMGVLIRRMRLDTDVMSLTSGEAEANPTVSTVEITSEREAKEFVSCKTILLCNNPNNCDIDLFAAVKDCGLVFDGGVVVDKVCPFFCYVHFMKSNMILVCSHFVLSTSTSMQLGISPNIPGAIAMHQGTPGL